MSPVKVIETKVIAAAAGAGAGAAVGEFLLWLMGVLVWHQPYTAVAATEASAAVPQPVSALLVLVVSILGASVGGYKAPHTARPDLVPPDPAGTQLTSETAPAVASSYVQPAFVFPESNPGISMTVPSPSMTPAPSNPAVTAPASP